MINFDEEIKRFKPALELDQAEDAIYNNDLKDIMDVMQEMMRVARKQRSKEHRLVGRLRYGRCTEL